MGATRVTCMIMLILVGASFMSSAMAYTGIPLALAAWIGSLNLSPYALIAALTVMYVILARHWMASPSSFSRPPS
jgi:TRAP-type C4-dicarboxylate transport system permease large subunit